MKQSTTINRIVELIGSIGSWLAPVIVYFATIAPCVTAGDAGEFVTATFRFSMPHPPGYPLYMLLLKLWSALPFAIGPDPLAVKCTLFSAVVMAIMCGVFYRLARTLTGSAAASLAATLVLAFSRTLWKFAVVTEVYALHLLLIVLVLMGLAIAREGKKPIGLVIAAFAFGLGLAHHHTILLLIPMIIFLWPRKIFEKGVPVAGIVVGLILPLVFYLFLPVLASNTPRYAESGFTEGNFVDTITRAEFRQRTSQQDLPPEQLVQPKDTLSRSLRYLPKQFGWMGWLILGLSVVGWFFAPPGKRAWAFCSGVTALIWILAVSFLSRGSPLGMPFNFLRSVDEFLIPVNIFLALGFAWILTPLANALITRKDFAGTEGQNIIPPRYIPVAIMLLLCAIPILLGLSNKARTSMVHHTYAQDQSRNILEQVPENGVLVVSGDEIFMFEYLQEVRGLREDIDLMESLGDIFTEELGYRDYVFTSTDAAQIVQFIHPPKALRLDGVVLTLIDREEGMDQFIVGDPNIWTLYDLRNLDLITLNSVIFDDYEYEVIDRYISGLRASVGKLENDGYSEDLATKSLKLMADTLEIELAMTDYPMAPPVERITGD